MTAHAKPERTPEELIEDLRSAIYEAGRRGKREARAALDAPPDRAPRRKKTPQDPPPTPDDED